MPTFSPSSRRGFSLVDLLIVAVIVIVLFVFFVPLLRPNHDGARRASCMSNEKQLGLGFLQYVQDNDNLPPVGPRRDGTGWAGEIYPYVKSAQVYTCPEDGRTAGTVSYGYNNSFLQLKAGKGTEFTDLPHPAISILLFEVSQVNSDVTTPDEGASSGRLVFSAAGDGASLLSGPNGKAQYALSRHRHKASYLFADGHVKCLTPGIVSVGPNADAASLIAQGGGPHCATFSLK